MPLVTLQDVAIQFRGPALLDGVDFQIDPGERVALLGRNGEGKTTLLRILRGEIEPERGAVICSQGVKTALLTQQVPQSLQGTVFDVVAEGLGERGRLLAKYHQVSAQLAIEDSASLHKELDRLGHALDSSGAWQIQPEVEQVLSRMDLQAYTDTDVSTLSAGLKRRVLLAQTLAAKPDVLLLDEPTNHLDIDSIRWLEKLLLREETALLFVTHDRVVLKTLATRIVELDRGRLSSWPGDYETFLQRRAAALEAEAQQLALFDKRLAQEEAWIRQGIKARRTRNEGRVKALKRMREERRQVRTRPGVANLQLQEAERSGRLVIKADGICHRYDRDPVIEDCSTLIMRGDRVGIIGPNGCGKTTLLRILLGELAPNRGTVRHGTRLEVAYFDQLHAQLDDAQSVMDNVGLGSESVVLDGRKRHLLGYLQDFLFTPEQARMPVQFLSGGERNRLLLARLFVRPSNVLVMDEPTNDLDIETLELLEERLLQYSGTLLVVSHDREFLNNVVTSTLVFEGDGLVKEYAGGYDDWLRQRPVDEPETPVPAKRTPTQAAPPPAPKRPAKLAFHEKRELQALPEQIEELETQLATLQQEMAAPTFYQQDRAAIVTANERLQTLEQELATVYARWETLEKKAQG